MSGLRILWVCMGIWALLRFEWVVRGRGGGALSVVDKAFCTFRMEFF